MNKYIKLTMILLVVFAVSGCGTIMGVKEMVNIDTNVSEAEILVNGVSVGEAPGAVIIKPKDVVSLKKDGYRDQVVPIFTKFNTWVIGNILLGGIPGLIVDAATGSMKMIEGNYFKANMKEDKGDN